MINIYSYEKTYKLLSGEYKNLEDTTMFNDTITVYKGLTNTISFKIRNRDRVSITPPVVILNIKRFDNNLLVSRLYLELIESDKFYKADLSPLELDHLDVNTKYMFFLTYEENGIERPLYTDHNYSIEGEFNLKEPHTIPSELEVEFDDNFISNGYVRIDESMVALVFRDKNNTITTTELKIYKHRNIILNYDVNDSKLWSLYSVIYPSTHETDISFLPRGHYKFEIVSPSKYGKSIKKFYIDR